MKSNEMDILIKEFPGVKEKVIGSIFILCKFCLDETRKVLTDLINKGKI